MEWTGTSQKNKHKCLLLKNCSTPLAIREVQIEITLRFHLTLIKMIKKTNDKCWQILKEKKNPYSLMVRVQTSVTTKKANVEGSPQIKHTANKWFNYTPPGHITKGSEYQHWNIGSPVFITGHNSKGMEPACVAIKRRIIYYIYYIFCLMWRQ